MKAESSRFEMFGGNSKATAIFTGIVSNYISQNAVKDFHSIQFGLMSQATRNLWNNKKDDSPKYLVNSFNIEILKDLLALIKLPKVLSI